MKCAIIFLSLVIIFWGVSCNKDSYNPTQQGAINADLSGTWIIERTDKNPSQGGTIARSEIQICKLVHSGNTFQVVMNEISYTGQINGTNIQFTGSFPEGPGITTINFTGTVKEDGNSFTGTANWTWKSDASTESGVSDIVATKNQNRKIYLSGQWGGTYTSYNGYGSGSFSLVLVQSDSIITGTIDIPSLGVDQVEVSGKIIDQCWSVGNIQNTITFIGIMANDSLHFRGNYSYQSADEGKWEAVKTSNTQPKMLLTINSFPVNADYDSDLTFDGSNIWLLGSNMIYKYNTDGQLLDSINTPGDYPAGLAFDGTNLINMDGDWGTKKIFFLAPDGSSIVKIPVQGIISGITFTGNDVWCLDQIEKKIYKVSSNGNIIKEISLTNSFQPSGLTYADNHLWYLDFNGSDGKMNIYKMDLNGNIISSFITKGSMMGGLAFNGTNLLNTSTTDGKIYEYSLDGTFKAEHNVNISDPSQIGCDGNNIWLTSGYTPWASMIYKLNSSFQVVDSMETPGNNTMCFTFVNNILWCYDSNLRKIIKTNMNGLNYFKNPVAEEIDYLCYNNSKIWALKRAVNKIYSFSTNGQNVNSFDTQVHDPKGITINGNDLWLIGLDNNYNTYLYKSTLTGEITESIKGLFADPTGLTFDGEYFWVVGRKTSPYSPSLYLYKLKIQ